MNMVSVSDIKYNSEQFLLLAVDKVVNVKTDIANIEKTIPVALDTINKIRLLHQSLTITIIPRLYNRAFNYRGKSNVALAKRLPDIMEDALNEDRLDLVAKYFNVF